MKNNQLTMHLLNRKKMFWKEPGDDSKFVCLKNISNNKLVIIRNVIQKYSTETNNIWFGFTSESWITAINTELFYRNKQANLIIKNNLNYLPVKAPKNNLVPINDIKNCSNLKLNSILKSLII